LKVGERSIECGSQLLPAGESTELSGDVMAVDGVKETVYCDCESLETTEATLCLAVGGSLPLRLSAPLPLRLVLVVVRPGLLRPWPSDSESLTLFETSLLSAAPGSLLKLGRGESSFDTQFVHTL
jgi:hypothetical protein